MSLNISEYPQRVVNNNPATISRWIAAHHPIAYKMERKDFDVVLSAFGATQMRVSLVGFPGNLSSILSEDDEVYIETANDSGVFTVDTVELASFIVTIGDFEGLPDVFGFTNFLNRENYFVATNVWVVDAESNYVFVGQSINKPDNTGRVTVDVSSFLRNVLDYIDEFQYDQINWKDLTLGGGYNITYSENWLGYEGPFSGLSTDELNYFTNSSKQIQDLYGQNMGEYVPFIETEEGDPKAKFLSDFEKPTYFPGFPFSMGFLYSESIARTKTCRNVQKLDVNGNNIGAVLEDQLSNDEALNVNRLMIPSDLASNVDSVDLWITNDENVQDCLEYIEDDYVDDDYFQEQCNIEVGLPAENPGAGAPIGGSGMATP